MLKISAGAGEKIRDMISCISYLISLYLRDADGLAHGADGPLFQPGDLGLGDPQGAGHLHLGLSVVKPQGEDLLFPVVQRPEGIAQGDVVHPAVLGILGIPDLVHHRQRVAAVGVDRIVQAHRRADRVQRLADLLQGKAQLPGDFLQRRFPSHAGGHGLLTLQHLVGHIPDGPGDPDGAVVPQIPSNLSRDHGNDCRM